MMREASRPRSSGAHIATLPRMRKLLWIIVAILLIFWLIGAVVGFLGDIIHFVLVVAIVLAVLSFIRRKV